MTNFLGEHFLLSNDTARRLYFYCARDLPIIDYHCHIEAQSIVENQRFSDLTDAWLAHDHYKWRLMRTAGVEERFITGDSPAWEKFFAFSQVLPRCPGNPVYHWTHMELQRYFDCDLPLTAATAHEIWTHCNARMPTVRDVIESSNVEIIVTADAPDVDLSHHVALATSELSFRVLPGMRVDNRIGSHAASTFRHFDERGCKLVDFGTDDLSVIRAYAPEIASRGWVMLLHLRALRNVNPVLHRVAGANSGGDAMGSQVDISKLSALFADLHNLGILPNTVVFSLNPNDCVPLTVLAGSFPNIFVGPAWWFNDNLTGIADSLNVQSSHGVLGAFPGMVTDSRSIFSYVRHDYFRRILCNMLGSFVERGEYPLDFDTLFQLIRDVCHGNSKRLLTGRSAP